MKVTLRKANALQNSINEVVRGIDVKSDLALTEFHNPEQEIARAVGEVKSKIARRDSLQEALHAIRLAVAATNHTCGVNSKLTEVAHLEKQIQFYAGLAGKEVRESADVLAGKLRKMGESEPKSRIYGYNDSVNTSVFTAEDIAGFKKIVADLKRLKQKIQDEILELNIRNEVSLEDNVVNTLKTENLV